MDRIFVEEMSNASEGVVKLSYAKTLWLLIIFTISIFGAIFTFSIESFAVFSICTAVTLCFGHSLGMHRRLIHRSYHCPKWLEYFFVYQGVLVGLAGPFGMIKNHDMRDWAQRQSKCHDYFAHRQSLLKDAYWQLFCDIELKNSPKIVIEESVAKDTIYQIMDKYWMAMQLPMFALLYMLGGVSWVIWGGFVRISVSVLGHWLVGYFAHNEGERHWHVEGASVQGFNIPIAAVLTMGESWHNNHHAFPGSAKIGLKSGELDIGWEVLKALKKVGLIWAVREPNDLPERTELTTVVDKEVPVHTGIEK